MPDQTPEPLTDERLRQLRDDENVCANEGERSMAAELLDARYRIAELKAVGECLHRMRQAADDWAAWFAAERDHWRERLAMGFQPWGRRVSELEADVLDARVWARHGYEIGQRSCTWSDHGVAPAWLTEGHSPESLQPTEEQRRMFGLDEENARLRARITTLEEQARVHRREYRELHVSCEKHVEKVHEFRVYLAEIVDALGEPEDTRFDALPEVARKLRARIAELEAPVSEPHAYIAVKRIHSSNADRPEWDWHATVIPAGDEYAEDRDWRKDRGFDLLPIVGTETVTRPAAAPQSDPVGYAVVTRNPEGGLHRSATIWETREQANTAEGIQSGYAEDTGCSAAVYELREVNGDA